MTLEEFINSEIKKRSMSMREFAKYIGVAPSTISQFLSNDERKVSIDFLVKLSEGTNTDLATIVAMVYPERTGIDAETRILAERIAQLPPEQYKVIETLLRGFDVELPKIKSNNPDLVD